MIVNAEARNAHIAIRSGVQVRRFDFPRIDFAAAFKGASVLARVRIHLFARADRPLYTNDPAWAWPDIGQALEIRPYDPEANSSLRLSDERESAESCH
jgi:hypothetical protein